MEKENRLMKYGHILRHYAVEPNFIEDFGRVQKVYANKGVFALKKISPHHGADFIKYIQTLYQKGYNRIVPIYPTVDGRYAVLQSTELYYLMPWMANEEKENRFERHQQMFRELARLHVLSVKDIPINKEDREEHYDNTINEWDKQNEFLNGFIEECESRDYMSPYELLFTQYYNDISQALKYSKNKLKEWYEKTKDDEKARTVIIHGKVSPEHFLYDERGLGYFMNFEESRQSSPMHDLLPFLARSLKTFPKRADDAVDWLYTYLKHFPFRDDEMLLFQSYFANPGPVIRAAEKYHNSKGKKSERKHVQHIQRQFWLLKNTEYVAMRIDEIERQKKQAQAEAAAKAEQEGAQGG
ncbi:spore coat protein YsxE [Cytobacillus horneckiae]|uniref:spore coat protein YsxE n=1 Tax=Cytobacillus horneckiae TaxID=549687 RepID=UPI0019D1E501|nr:spore coat protein YsxE [Cytobacillus horneckiae]MBN6887884.1 spore coat protein YsxE [Cytobacillus horneckiae]MCM3179702.1 spore coat protein YsxE [Cytobacillus horneckiae]